MESMNRILVCVRSLGRASRLLSYAGALSRAAKSEEVHLLHVTLAEDYSGQAGPPRNAEPDEQQLRAAADEHLSGHGGERIICGRLPGSPLVEILRYALEHDIDLIIMGRLAEEHGDGATLDRRIATKATCSVLVIPEGATFRANRILVPVRNSECSARAVEAACLLAACTEGTVFCLNVFPVRGDYLEAELTLDEHTTLMRQWAERENTQLLATVSTGGARVETQCRPDVYGRPAKVILEEVGKDSPDLVVIGARGRTGAAGVLLGAVTEQLICRSPVPVLAVKKKGECIGVLRALLTLAS